MSRLSNKYNLWLTTLSGYCMKKGLKMNGHIFYKPWYNSGWSPEDIIDSWNLVHPEKHVIKWETDISEIENIADNERLVICFSDNTWLPYGSPGWPSDLVTGWILLPELPPLTKQ